MRVRPLDEIRFVPPVAHNRHPVPGASVYRADIRDLSDEEKPAKGGLFVGVSKGAQTTFRLGALVIGLKAVVKKLLYISLIFWDSATKVS
jgi:hypothetical protein